MFLQSNLGHQKSSRRATKLGDSTAKTRSNPALVLRAPDRANGQRPMDTAPAKA
jgi:hypothetical protein